MVWCTIEFVIFYIKYEMIRPEYQCSKPSEMEHAHSKSRKAIDEIFQLFPNVIITFSHL